ncbi:MAG TPA: hypothetical protein VKZ82_19620 [Nonomuraea sp.]|uniref:hypothetical protein n=1 Tax=Nonomuraea sp. NPDC049649 TaxID=3155776 RepID=UPI002B6A6DA9|nr:hypothetical protein [Nonomuraea sp.]
MEDLPGLVAAYGQLAGFSQTVIYVADLQQLLVPLAGQRDVYDEPLEPIRIDATVAGRAFRNVEIVEARHVTMVVLPVRWPARRRLTWMTWAAWGAWACWVCDGEQG